MADEMTEADLAEYKLLNIYLGEGTWTYAKRDLELAKQIARSILSHTPQPEGGIEIEPPRRRLGDTTVDPDPIMILRYQKGFMRYEAQFHLNLVYDEFMPYEIDKLIWGQFPALNNNGTTPGPGPIPTISPATPFHPFGLRVDKMTII